MPAQHSPSAQRNPTIRLADLACQLLVKRVAVSHVEQPAAIGLAPFEHDADSFLDSGIRLNVGRA
jgi:hypothetical protein